MARTKFASLRPDLLALAIVLALPSSFAFAQDAEKAAEPTKPTTLEAVKVTAERRVEDIQDVPVSITAIGGPSALMRPVTRNGKVCEPLCSCTEPASPSSSGTIDSTRPDAPP